MSKSLRNLILIMFILVQSVFVSGCWHSREVEELAIITALGIDRTTVNGSDKWLVTMLILNPKGNSDTQTSKGSPPGEILVKGTGTSFQDAFLDINKRMPKMNFFGQNSLVVLGENVSKDRDKLIDLIESYIRYPEAHPNASVMVVRGQAFELLQAKPEGARSLSKELAVLAKRKVQATGESPNLPMDKIMHLLLCPDQDAVIPEVKLFYPAKGEETVPKTVIIEGMAVLRDNQLAGYFNDKETSGFLLITERINNAQIPITINYQDNIVGYTIRDSKSKIKVQPGGDKLKFLVTIKTKGIIIENNGLKLTPEMISLLEEAISAEIKNIAYNSIMKAKEYEADIFGFVLELHRHDLDKWREIQDHWREEFINAEIEIEVDSKVINVGKVIQDL